MSSIDDRVKKIVSERLGVDVAECTNNASFVVDLGASEDDEDGSVTELIMAFEEEFDVSIPDDDAEDITTVGEAIACLRKAGAR